MIHLSILGQISMGNTLHSICLLLYMVPLLLYVACFWQSWTTHLCFSCCWKINCVYVMICIFLILLEISLNVVIGYFLQGATLNMCFYLPFRRLNFFFPRNIFIVSAGRDLYLHDLNTISRMTGKVKLDVTQWFLNLICFDTFFKVSVLFWKWNICRGYLVKPASFLELNLYIKLSELKKQTCNVENLFRKSPKSALSLHPIAHMWCMAGRG